MYSVGVRKLSNWIGDHILGFEIFVSFISVTCTYLIAVYATQDWSGTAIWIKAATRSSIYTATASVSASLLGFVMALIAIMFSLHAHAAFNQLKLSTVYAKFWDIYKSASVWLLLCLMCSLVALALNHWHWLPDTVLLHLVAALTILALLRVGNCVWLLHLSIDRVVAAAPDDEQTRRGFTRDIDYSK